MKSTKMNGARERERERERKPLVLGICPGLSGSFNGSLKPPQRGSNSPKRLTTCIVRAQRRGVGWENSGLKGCTCRTNLKLRFAYTLLLFPHISEPSFCLGCLLLGALFGKTQIGSSSIFRVSPWEKHPRRPAPPRLFRVVRMLPEPGPSLHSGLFRKRTIKEAGRFWAEGEAFETKDGFARRKGSHLAVVVKTVLGSHFGGLVSSPPILEPILVGIGMFTGGTGF